MRLNSKISLIIIPLITIPLFLVGVYSYYLLWHKNMDNSHTQLEYYVNHLKKHVNEQLTESTITLKTLAKDSLVKQYLLTENEADRYMLMQKPMLSKLSSIQQSNPKLREISLLLPNGYEELRISNRNSVNYTEDESESGFFKAMQKKHAGFYYFVDKDPDINQYVMYISTPVIFRDRTRDTFTTRPQVRGYLTATFELEPLLFPQIPAPWDKGSTFLSGNDRIYLSHSTQNQDPIQDHSLQPLQDLPVNQWSSTSVNNHKVQHFSVELTDGLVFHIYIPESILLASSLSINSFILALAALMLIISVPLMLKLFRRHVLHPIDTLNQALDQLKCNGTVPNLQTTTSDELNKLVASFNHINTELYRSNQRIRNLAYIDTLTGLPNRTLFQRNLLRAIDYAEREHEMLALLYLDLDNFKYVNDNMGHATGDTLLQTIANILRESLRTDDMATRVGDDDPKSLDQNERDNFSRLGGDEFTILLPHLKAPYQAGLIAERIIDAINRPIPIGDHTVYITASIGIALWTDDTNDSEELVTCADQAMYQAKQSGKNKYCYYSPTISKQTKERAKIEQRLYQATERGCFEVHYQPIVDSMDLKIQSYEALIRWNDEELGFVPPDKFIHIAEENGLIMRIGLWIITNVCAQIQQWHKAGYSNFKVGINLSALQVNNADIVKEIETSVKHYDIPYESLYVELTESSVIKGDEQVMRNLRKLREIGIHVALDDFGTGYSSLGYLRTLPIDILKIDRAFIKDLHEGNNSTILSAIVTMAHALHMKVVVEGIEEHEQLQYLPQKSSVLIQGYLFSPPKPAEEAIQLLKGQHEIEERLNEPHNR
ncbi:bifunctional diguanylate cyclase/phosphodiesterase [Vibrio sp. HA2012]|uniref:bifunctional diguanylate cyclase/phosphodiesterase n=1 Tax=Vibrio sp. HA2012 TaxID=1971595 RepID=UPI0018E20CFB|nr:EAL domain-containing protein [Vibrio sp. HA2012]